MNCVRLFNGCAAEIWPGKNKSELTQLFTAELLEQTVETPDAVAINDLWDGASFSTPVRPAQTVITYAAFRGRLTDAEKAGMHAARGSSWQIDDLIGLAQAQNSVDLSSELVAAAKALLVTAGVFDQPRADEVFLAQ